MKILWLSVKRIFTGYTAGKAQGVDFQCRVIAMISMISAPTVGIFSVFNFFGGRIELAVVEAVATMLFLYCIFSACNQSRLKFKVSLLLGISWGLFLALFIDGAVAKDGIYWSLLFPFLAMLLLGLPRAWYWVISYALVLAGVIAGHIAGLYVLPYEDSRLMYFPATYGVSALFSAAFEAQFERLHIRYEKTIHALQSLQNNLEKNIHSRTLALEKANGKLQDEVNKHETTMKALKDSEHRFFQAQKMETIGTLVGGIAHDFNNMLAGINANLFMIKRGTKDNPDIQKRSGDIEQLVMRASDMVKQLLTFARKDKVELEQVDLVVFIEEAFKLAEISISSKIQIKLENLAGTLPIQANATQLQQVLMNMLNNARDAVKKVKSPCIIVKVERYLASDRFKRRNPDLTANTYATLTVIDNGSGIDAEALDKIFEPFYSTKEVGKGTGLGLAMCYGAIQSHRGTIEVQSLQGQGTGFKIYIPICHDDVVEKPFDDSGTVSVGLGETILLVDDDQSLIESQTAALQALGYQVLEARNGKEAVKIFEKHHQDIRLVVTDVTMPVMGGVQAAKRMRVIEPNIHIVFVTGYDKDDTLDDIPHMDECILEKPYTMDKLNTVIQRQMRSILS